MLGFEDAGMKGGGVLPGTVSGFLNQRRAYKLRCEICWIWIIQGESHYRGV
jgi:hypothetical protein